MNMYPNRPSRSAAACHSPTNPLVTPMPLLDHLIERTAQSSHHKRHKRCHSTTLANEMSFFSASSNLFLNPSSRKKNQRVPDEVEHQFTGTDDLELSFASNVSLNSPPREHISLAASDCEPMDISPAPVKVNVKQRPRAYTGGSSRLFGSDLSNSKNPLLPSPHLAGQPAKAGAAVATQSNAKKIQRSALPTEWLTAARAPEPPSPIVCTLVRATSMPRLSNNLTFASVIADARTILSDGRCNGCRYILRR